MRADGWIGVDLDGTLAEYHGWEGYDKIGKAIPTMVERIKAWTKEGVEVRILTARAKRNGVYDYRLAIIAVQDWLEANGMPRLQVTNEKDLSMIELWDDRCVQVIPNTGLRADEEAYARGRRQGYKMEPDANGKSER